MTTDGPKKGSAGNRNRYDVQVRDPDGLTLIQKKLLVSLLEENSWRRACEVNDVTYDYFRRMLQTDKAFQREYNGLLSSVLQESRAKLTRLMPRVGEVFEEGLDAEKEIEVDVTCPECDHDFKALAPIPHWAIKLRIADSLLKAHGMTTHRVEHTGRIEHRNMTLEDLIARARYQRGEGIPPDVEEDLRARGLLGGASQDPDPPLEGEYNVLSPESPGTPDG